MADAMSLSELAERVDALQTLGAEQFDPVAFRFLQSQCERLAQLRHNSPRTLARLGDTLTQLEQRLSDCEKAVEQKWDRQQQPELTPLYEQQAFKSLLRRLSPAPSVSPLAEVLTLLKLHGNNTTEPENRDPLRAMLQEQEGDLFAEESALPQPANEGPRELKALSRVRAGQQQQRKRRRIEDALTQTPSDAGPLNSHRLVTRAISALQELSPAYLDHFVSYVDTLMVLEKTAKKRS